MSNLYVRVMTGFYQHRKTVRLRSRIGMDAYWVPPRIWAYCAEHQTDGNLSGYSAEEIAELIGYQSNAKASPQAMLQALKDCCFIDESGIVHDWEDHNGYHAKYKSRAQKAAAARWKKEKSPTPPKEEEGKGNRQGGKHCLSDATSITADVIYSAYPLKVGKPAALRAISKAMTKIDPSVLLETTKAYALRRANNLAFTPHPSTWFNQERYLDDQSTWINNENHANPNSQRPDRSVGTLNEGLAAQYEGLGRLVPVPHEG